MLISRVGLAGLVTAASLVAVGCDSAEKKTETKTAAADKKAPAGKDKKADAKADAKAEPAKDEAGKDAEPAKDDAAKKDDAPEAAGGGGVDAPTVPAGDAGAAYFAIDDKGIFVLDGGTITAVKKGPDKLVRQMSVGADGGTYLLGFDGIVKLDGTSAKVVAKTSYKNTGSLEAFTVTPDGKFWGVGFKGVSFYNGKKWETEEKSVLGADVSLLKGVALDKDGKVWVASSNKLHFKDGEAWKEVDVSKAAERKPFFDGLLVDPASKALFAPASSVVVKATATDAVEKFEIANDGISSFGLLAFAQNGIGALRTDPRHVARFTPDGKVGSYELGKDFEGTRVHALSVDGQGRVWVATDIGITVMGPAAERAKWRSGSVPELAGKVKGMLVVGAGPDLPEVGEVKTAGLKGVVLVDGAELAKAPVEICPEPGSLIKASPCEDSPVKFSGTTGDDGSFEFADVPLGAYGVAVKVEDKWKITFSGAYGAKMKEGAVLDIGKLKLKGK